MITCSVCGHLNDPSRATCEECGSDLSDSPDWGVFDDDELDDDDLDDNEFEDDEYEDDSNFDDNDFEDDSNFDEGYDDLNVDYADEMGYADPDFYD